MIVPALLEEYDRSRYAQAGNERRRESKAVMRVELKLGQEVARGDAEKRACGGCQRVADQWIAADAERRGPEMKEQGSGRHGERVTDVHQVAMPNRAAADRHQRAERERVERFVQHDDEEHRQTGPGRAVSVAQFHIDGSRQGDAVEQTMKRQA